jgi:glycosyltransferase involved in cell wall biosynthesis
MKILFLTDNFYPETNAPANRTYEHSQEWIKMGHKVTVITGVPNFPKGKIFKGYTNKLFQSELIDKILVKRVWTYIAENKGFFLRILDYISFMISSFFCGIFTKKHDVVIATSPQFFTLISGYLISIIRRTPLVIEIRDLWPESIVALGSIKKSNIFIKILYKIAHFIYKKSSLIIVVTNSFKDHLLKMKIEESKIIVITNGFNFERSLSPKSAINDLENLYDIRRDQFIVSYIGTIGMSHGVDIVVKAAEKANDVIFLIIGEGAEKENLISLSNRKNLKNIRFIDSLNWQQIVDINQLISVNLIHLRDLEIFKTVIPSKIFESMALKKPILIGLNGESLKIIEDSQSGLPVVPESADSLIDKIRYLQMHETFLINLAKNGENYVKQNYDRKKLAHKMIKFIQSRIN